MEKSLKAISNMLLGITCLLLVAIFHLYYINKLLTDFLAIPIGVAILAQWVHLFQKKD